MCRWGEGEALLRSAVECGWAPFVLGRLTWGSLLRWARKGRRRPPCRLLLPLRLQGPPSAVDRGCRCLWYGGPQSLGQARAPWFARCRRCRQVQKELQMDFLQHGSHKDARTQMVVSLTRRWDHDKRLQTSHAPLPAKVVMNGESGRGKAQCAVAGAEMPRALTA